MVEKIRKNLRASMDAFKNGRFSLLNGYQKGRYKDNNTKIEMGYNPATGEKVGRGEKVFGYIVNSTSEGKVARIMTREQALEAYRKSRWNPKVDDKITKVYGTAMDFGEEDKERNQAVRVTHVEDVYVNPNEGSVVFRTNRKRPENMGIRRYFSYGKKDNDKDPQYNYNNLDNATKGSSVFGYIYGTAEKGDEVQVMTREEALEIYERECRENNKSYEVGDCLTKVYGQVIDEGKGNVTMEVVDTNPVYVDLRNDRYEFRSKKKEIEPAVNEKEQTIKDEENTEKELLEKEVADNQLEDKIERDDIELKEKLEEEKNEALELEQEELVIKSDEQKEIGLGEKDLEQDRESEDKTEVVFKKVVPDPSNPDLVYYDPEERKVDLEKEKEEFAMELEMGRIEELKKEEKESQELEVEPENLDQYAFDKGDEKEMEEELEV